MNVYIVYLLTHFSTNTLCNMVNTTLWIIITCPDMFSRISMGKKIGQTINGLPPMGWQQQLQTCHKQVLSINRPKWWASYSTYIPSIVPNWAGEVQLIDVATTWDKTRGTKFIIFRNTGCFFLLKWWSHLIIRF